MQVTENPEGLRRKREKRHALLANLGLLAGAVAGLIFLRGRRSILPLAALPWIAILLVFRSKGGWKLDHRKNDPKPSLPLPFLLPGFFLLLVTIADIHPAQWPHALGLTLTLAAVLSTAAIKADRELGEKSWKLILVFLLLASYGYGGGMQVNAALDSSTPSIHPIRVLGKRMTLNRGNSYYLQLEPWGSLPQKEISVPRSTYQAIEAGDTVCATLHRGALRVAWYTVNLCR